jgi:hypothetical protein
MPGRWFKGFGALRLMLAALAVVLILLGPVSGGEVSFEGIKLYTTLLAPTLYVVVAFVLPLDMMMTLLFRAEAKDDAVRRGQLNRVLITEALLLVAMLLSWLPFVLELLRIR